MAFVAAYDKRTGVKHSVPEHWLDHPVLGRPFEKTPRQRAAEKKASPADTTTKTPASPDKKED